jgi:hypothetical protein
VSEEAELRAKIRRLAELLLLPRPKVRGVRDWEIRRVVGKDYEKIIELLNHELDKIGLEVKLGKEAVNDEERRYYVVSLKSSPTISELKFAGYRIDELAVLAASIAYINSKGGKAGRKEIEDMLSQKMPRWRIEISLNKFIRRGYLEEKNKMLSLGWRTKLEVDMQTLTNLILSTSPKSSKP